MSYAAALATPLFLYHTIKGYHEIIQGPGGNRLPECDLVRMKSNFIAQLMNVATYLGGDKQPPLVEHGVGKFGISKKFP
ncbi:hypothetical protein GGF32_000510 [Allomyces javanicus]|nr:hypothetical protein GGF32_000510 [Allomyces javanicus]